MTPEQANETVLSKRLWIYRNLAEWRGLNAARVNRLMAPLTVIDYILVHELCHLHHRDHSDAFWNEVDKVLPDYRDRKEWLRMRGAELDL